MVRHLPVPLEWTPLNLGDPEASERSSRRLCRVLRSWENTPYVPGKGYRGKETDCVRSVVLTLSEWTRSKPPQIDTLPADAALHSRRGALEALHRILTCLPDSTRVEGKQVMPGDVLITGPRNGGPGHAIIVGTQPNTMWQAISTAGFVKCGWSLDSNSKIFSVRRFIDLSATC